MIPELAHLPPGIVPLVLILGGLAFAIPVTVATLLRPRGPHRAKNAPRVRPSVLVHARAPGTENVPLTGLTPIDAALESVHRAGAGDPRVLFSDARRKLVRVTHCSCERDAAGDGRDPCGRTQSAIREAFTETLPRDAFVTEIACTRGRCDFLVQY